MRVELHTSFAASRKEPLLQAMDRVRQAFLDAGLGEPAIHFTFGDGALRGSISCVDRVLKRHPELEPFVTAGVPSPLNPGARRISNQPGSPSAGQPLPYTTLQAIAAGVPRSFPFHGIALHFTAPEFGEIPHNPLLPNVMAGVLLSDSWWVNGRNRSLSACTVVEAEAASKKLPPLPPAVAAVLAACGKVKRTVQVPIAAPTGTAARMPVLPGAVSNVNPEAALKVREIVLDYRARMSEILAQASLPHLLPTTREALQETGLGVTAGPKKPALEAAFQPLGYSCRGGSGTFTLRRRTPSNLTVELYMDVGTWSHSVIAMFRVLGLGFKASLTLPVSENAASGGQYPIGPPERWQKIVENYAALVAELDRSFVPAIEAAAGPSPEWYQPES
jgi:hypothetical protein